ELRALRRGSIGLVSCASFSPAGDVLATTAGNDTSLRTWSPSTDDPRVVTRHGGGVYDVEVVPGTRMVVSAGLDGHLGWSDARTGERPASKGCSATGQNAWTYLAASPDGRSLAA